MSSLQILHLLLELLDADHVSLDFMLNYSHGSVTDLIGQKELMELREVGVCLENVQQVQSELERLLEVVPERAGYRPEQCLMLEHVLHVLVAETQVEQAHSTLDLVLNGLLIEALDILVQVLDTDLREVYLGAFRFLQRY